MKYGSAQLNLFLCDGRNLLGMKAKGLSTEEESIAEDTTGIGDSAQEFTPVGRLVSRLTQEEAFYDGGVNRAHELFTVDPVATRVMMYSFEGDVAGKRFIGHEGTLVAKYKVLASNGNLTKAQTEYTTSGARDEGIILIPTSTYTDELFTSSTFDNGAATESGAAAYLQILDADVNITGTVQDSANGDDWDDLILFDQEGVISAQRWAVEDAVKRYVRFIGELADEGTVTICVGFVRYPDPPVED